ncbi:RNA-binding region-containing protein 3 [Sorochytrium milnesiophthora]
MTSLMVKPVSRAATVQQLTTQFAAYGPSSVEKQYNFALLHFTDVDATKRALQGIHRDHTSLRVKYFVRKASKASKASKAPEAAEEDVFYAGNSTLAYRYPPPNPATLLHIVRSVRKTPRLYVQVLHLMNKMNLDPPFDETWDINTTDMYGMLVDALGLPPDYFRRRRRRRGQDMLATDESELESELESDSEDKETAPPPAKKQRQMPPALLKPRQRKLPTPIHHLDQLHIAFQRSTDKQPSENAVDAPAAVAEAPADVAAWRAQCISDSDLVLGRATDEELGAVSAYKNYLRGEPSRTVYVKNLARKATAEDLVRLFGRYFDSAAELESVGDVRVLEGRMKGQAFVKMKSVQDAERAIDELLGYKLHGKPAILMFGKQA